jgi:hypothetical protein
VNRRFLRIIFFVHFFLICSKSLFAADSTVVIEPYTKQEFPQWANDLRRTEIIAFGSLPFVTIWVTVAYSAIVNGEFHSPIDKSSSGFSTSDQERIMQIAALSSLSLGLADLAVNLASRAIQNNEKKHIPETHAIIILPEKENDQVLSVPQDYLQGGIESAIF